MLPASKTTVSTLQEFCAKKKIPIPDYKIINDDELGFICEVEVMNLQERGSGRSKRDAKHLAASEMLKKLRRIGELDVETMEDAAIPMDTSEVLPPVDMVMMLRDYCVQNQHPLPKFELVEQMGQPNAPQFTMLCCIASIERFGTSDSKKDAKQRAAYAMFNAIKDSLKTIASEMEIVSLKTKMDSEQETRFKLFKTYRELVDSGENTEKYGVKMDERHDFFTHFHAELKKAAFGVLSTEYESQKTKALELLESLKITPRMDTMPSATGKNMLFIDLGCDGLDVCFAGYEPEIYSEINQYFSIMLV